MRSLNLPKTSLLLLIASCLGQAIASASNAPPHTHRILRAATKRSDLYRRSMRITKKFETELSYIEDENGWGGKTTFASQVRVASAKPILNLEEIEHHLKDVECYPGGMRLEFVDPSSARDAFYSCGGEAGGLIVTSHETCNSHGERSVYKVHDVSFANDGEALEISVTKSLFQDAFSQVDVSFGDTVDDHLFRRHSDFAKVRNKRQDIDIPVNISEGVTTASFDLSSEVLDTVFPGESFLAGLRDIVPIPQLPIEIGCKNCSTSGQILLTQGAFNIDLSQIDLIPDIFQGGDDGKEISNVITGGFLELAATGVGAHVDLFARPKASGNFEIALFSIPIVGFTIPGIGKAGAVFEPRIAADFDISGGFEINYGFEVAVPNDSKVRIELTDLSKSSINGFPGSTLTPLPFRTNITDLEILLGLAFKPNIPVGFEFLERITAEVSVTMTLPRIDAKLSSNKGANCGNETNSTLPSAPVTNSTTRAGNIIDLGPIALVQANVSVAVDAGFSVKFPLPPPFDSAGLEANLFKTVIPLITECAKPDVAFKSAKPIVAAPASMTYANASIKPSATPIPQFVLGWNATGVGYAIPTGTGGYIVKNPLATMQSHAAQSHVVVEEKSGSSKLVHGVTSLQAPTPTLSPAFALQNVTAVASDGQGEFTSAALPLAPSAALATDSFQPGNSSSVGVGSAAPSQFTGAAAPSIEVPILRLRSLWQVGMLGTSVLFGAMVL